MTYCTLKPIKSIELEQEAVAVQTITVIMKCDETQTDTATLDNTRTVETQTEVAEIGGVYSTERNGSSYV